MLAKFSSLVCEKSDARNPKTILSCQTALTSSVGNFSSKKKRLKSHITKQLMHSFEVNIRICQPEKVMSIEASLSQVDKNCIKSLNE